MLPITWTLRPKYRRMVDLIYGSEIFGVYLEKLTIACLKEQCILAHIPAEIVETGSFYMDLGNGSRYFNSDKALATLMSDASKLTRTPQIFLTPVARSTAQIIPGNEGILNLIRESSEISENNESTLFSNAESRNTYTIENENSDEFEVEKRGVVLSGLLPRTYGKPPLPPSPIMQHPPRQNRISTISGFSNSSDVQTAVDFDDLITGYDVMISYQLSFYLLIRSKQKVTGIHAALTTRHNLRVWTDFDQFQSDTSNVIDNSKVVLVVLNDWYQLSKSCLRELNYAADHRKNIVFALDQFEKNRQQSGPAFLIMAAVDHIDFTEIKVGTKEFDEKVQLLYKSISQYLGIKADNRDSSRFQAPRHSNHSSITLIDKNRSDQPPSLGQKLGFVFNFNGSKFEFILTDRTVEALKQEIAAKLGAATNQLDIQTEIDSKSTLADIVFSAKAGSVVQLKVTLKNLSNWLGPVDFSIEVERKYLEGTCGWVSDQLQNWLKSNTANENVLWLTGAPGSGKSFVLARIIEILEASNFSVSKFFFKRLQKNVAISMVFTIVRDFANTFPEFRSYIYEEYDLAKKLPIGEYASLFSDPVRAFHKLVIAGLQRVNHKIEAYIAVDALDDCGVAGDEARKQVLEIIKIGFPKLPNFVKIFVTASPQSDIYDALAKTNAATLIISGVAENHDIELYIKYQLTNIASQMHLVVADETVTECVKILSEKANGSFVYISLSFLDIENFWYSKPNEMSEASLITAFKDFEGSEDDLYIRILSQEFQKANRSTISLFQKVMGVILVIDQPVAQDFVADVLNLKPHFVGRIIVQMLRVLNINSQKQISSSETLRNFLTSKNRCLDERFFVDMKSANDAIDKWTAKVLEKSINNKKQPVAKFLSVHVSDLKFVEASAINFGDGNKYWRITSRLDKKGFGPGNSQTVAHLLAPNSFDVTATISNVSAGLYIPSLILIAQISTQSLPEKVTVSAEVVDEMKNTAAKVSRTLAEMWENYTEQMSGSWRVVNLPCVYIPELTLGSHFAVNFRIEHLSDWNLDLALDSFQIARISSKNNIQLDLWEVSSKNGIQTSAKLDDSDTKFKK
ncbi:hypothetical protein HK100_002890 [Physocladia obscura]|uniref:TIR domain-containing protein n=1 Tax=Physocladia obscura TaxID=109957 RepID=A0AAD5XH36_9FUNG|nr:hypothetical protein HK100_002890 [Physocladia obscura]